MDSKYKQSKNNSLKCEKRPQSNLNTLPTEITPRQGMPNIINTCNQNHTIRDYRINLCSF